MADKFELNIDELDNVAGGNEETTQNINNEKSNQQNNVNGDNINDITQVNNVSGNTGEVTIKSPVNIKDLKDSNITMNF